MDMHANTFRFDAGQPGATAWPIASVGLLATKLMDVLLSHVASTASGFAQLEHVIDTGDYDGSDDDCMLCALGEVTSRRFDMPVEGGVLPVKMIAEAFLNATRLRFVVDEQYASYLRYVVTPAPAEPVQLSAALRTPTEQPMSTTIVSNYADAC